MNSKDGKRKITFILSDKSDFYLLPLIESIKNFKCEVVTLGKPEDLNSVKTSVQVKLYEHVPEMPGYLRGLTDDLAYSDLIIAVDPSSLSSFQALRSARKWNRIFGLISNLNFAPAFSDESHEIKMMQEVLQSSSFTLTMTQTGKDFLQLEGAPNIQKIRPQVSNQLQFCEKKRDKFRSYIGIKDSDLLISIFVGKSEPSGREALLAFKYLTQLEPEMAKQLKFLIVSSEELGNLRYLASDLGIAKNILLLSQDLHDFYHDLSCAADIVIDADPQSQRLFQTGILDLFAGGAKIVIHSGNIMSEYAPPSTKYIHNISFQEISRVVIELASSKQEAGLFRDKRSIQFLRIFAEGQPFINEIIKSSLEGCEMTKKIFHSDMNERWELVAACNETKKYEDALTLIESIIEDCESEEKLSQAYEEKGHVFFKSGKIEKAMEAYDKSVQLDKENWKSYLGLAKVSLISHSEEDAVAFYKRVLALKPHQHEALAGIGMVYRMIGMPEDAIYWLNRSLTVNPSNEKVLLELTQACLECEELKEPIYMLEQLSVMHGDLPCLIMALGQLYMKDGKIELGRAMVAKALDSDPNHKPLSMVR